MKEITNLRTLMIIKMISQNLEERYIDQKHDEKLEDN